MLNNWVGNGRDIVIKEKIVGTCSLSEWVY